MGLLVGGLLSVPVGVVIVSLFMLVGGVAATTPPTTTIALAGYPQMAGTASSLLGMARFAIGGFVAPLVGIAGAATMLPLGIVTGAVVALAAASVALLPRNGRDTTPQGEPAPTDHDPEPAAALRGGHRPVAPRTEGVPTMRGVIMYGPGDVRVEDREKPTIVEPTDAIIRVTSACICGSDLWPYRGAEDAEWPVPMGHEYVGVVEEIGADVRNVAVGDFVVGSFFASDNTCEICRAGYQTHCIHRQPGAATGSQSEYLRVPLADGTLVATPTRPTPEQERGLLAASDVLGTGWFAAVAAEAGPGKTVAVVGDGAVGLLGILAAKQLGAERIIAFSRHADRQALARTFGATDIVEERGDEGVAKVKELTGGLGAHSTIEAVGTQESMMQAIRATRAGGHVGYVGVAHGVSLDGLELFFSGVHLHGGPAPVRRFLPELIDLIMTDRITPGDVFDLTLPVEQAAEGYRAMDERRAIKVLLTF